MNERLVPIMGGIISAGWYSAIIDIAQNALSIAIVAFIGGFMGDLSRFMTIRVKKYFAAKAKKRNGSSSEEKETTNNDESENKE